MNFQKKNRRLPNNVLEMGMPKETEEDKAFYEKKQIRLLSFGMESDLNQRFITQKRKNGKKKVENIDFFNSNSFFLRNK